MAELLDARGRPRVVVRWSLYEPKGFVLWVITTPAELVMVERAEGEPTFEQVPFVEPPTEGDGSAPSPERGDRETVREKNHAAANWDALVREYDALGLPRPPADARLVAKFHGMELVDVRDVAVPLHAPRYLPGFAWTAEIAAFSAVGSIVVFRAAMFRGEVTTAGPVPGASLPLAFSISTSRPGTP